ncbi:MAG: glycine--tRNA ligase subunit alpha [Planctomycetota bacterium]|nr:glycine--tRNA ligase subunit alpha [Planctomycetota bacterium]
MYFQDVIMKLNEYWASKGCALVQPYDIEKGAGTFNPFTFFGSLSPNDCRYAYVEPSRRPTDGRYGENPYRLQHYYQYQILIKPAPDDSQKMYLDSLRFLGIDVVEHDVRFIEDDWESPTLGATGLGWEVRLDGLEITQFTYFQQMGSFALKTIPLEITYGLERIAMFLQGVKSVFEIEWAKGVKYGDIHKVTEYEFSVFNFEAASVQNLLQNFEEYEQTAIALLSHQRGDVNEPLLRPAYDYLIKCSHTFNLLDARGAISPQQRTQYILRIRNLARRCAETFLKESKPKL